ncbi:hypothetical protein [Candidatus Lokiarchaeum ossiferum]|uniref:hypothetical protein n=1 Tax=Candidatus Lokiarchaeum ossiferum TaxID=2951803 RepID=UPI00352DE892
MSSNINATITCPTCQKSKDIEIPRELFETKTWGMVKVNIERDYCCEHAFLAYFNKKGENAGYEKLDIIFDLKKTEEDLEQFHLKDLLKQYGEDNTCMIIHAMILNTPIIFLHKKYFKENRYIKATYKKDIFQFIQLKQFLLKFVENTLSSITLEFDTEYNQHPRTDALIISPTKEIERLPWVSIPIDFELNIIHKAMDVLDESVQYLVIQDEMQKILKKAEVFNKILDKWAAIYEEDIRKQLDEAFETELDDYSYQLLVQILEIRFKADMSKIKNPTRPKQRRLR